MTTVIICGGRDYDNKPRAIFWFNQASRCFPDGITHVVEGGAIGADRIAHAWALASFIPVTTVPADWENMRKYAGPIRNAKMLKMFNPSAVLALPGGSGTLDMVNQARAAGVPVYLFPKLEPEL